MPCGHKLGDFRTPRVPYEGMSQHGTTFENSALSAMLELSGEGALIFEGTDLLCRVASAAAEEILGVRSGSLLGRRRSDVLGELVAGDEATERALTALKAVASDETRDETLAIKANPSRLLAWKTAPVLSNGILAGRADLITDRTVEALLREELDRAYARLSESSLTDDLTGLANRKHFDREIDREHRRSQRAWSSYAVARLDVDGMAVINETLGPETGDLLLATLAKTLKEARREYDLVARFEGDELVVLLPGIDERSVKAVLARSISAMMDVVRDQIQREVTLCTGVALWIPPSVEPSAGVVERAGLALRAAQIMGPGHMEVDARLIDWKDELSET